MTEDLEMARLHVRQAQQLSSRAIDQMFEAFNYTIEDKCEMLVVPGLEQAEKTLDEAISRLRRARHRYADSQDG